MLTDGHTDRHKKGNKQSPCLRESIRKEWTYFTTQ